MNIGGLLIAHGCIKLKERNIHRRIWIFAFSMELYVMYQIFILYVNFGDRNRDIGPAVRVFANGPGDLCSYQRL